MDALTKLRTLIWDKGAKVFTDEDLQEFLTDTANADGTHNVYRAAAFCLDIVRADPERVKQFSRGGVSMTYQDLTAAINRYKAMAGDRGVGSVSMEKVY